MDGPADTVEKIVELLNDKEKLAQYRYGTAEVGTKTFTRRCALNTHVGIER
jgi:hypothetical protein